MVEPADQKRARDLLARVKTVVDAGDTARLKDAEGWLKTAAELDPDNKDLKIINGRIAALKDKASKAPLPPADQALYLSAVQSFTNGDKGTAYATVKALLEKYPYSKILLDLKKKIEATL